MHGCTKTMEPITVKLYPHQVKAVKEMHNGCILCGGVGTGKSRTSLAYYAKENGAVLSESKEVIGGILHSPKSLYIITTAKKRDSMEWDEECARFNIFDPVIDSWNNIKKYTKVYDAFFIFDEQRVVGYGAWTKAFLDITRKNRWVLLSATPGDTWSDYIPVFIANGFYRNKTEFMRRHAVMNQFCKYPKIDRYVDVKVLAKIRNHILVNMPFERKTIPHYIRVLCNYDKELYKTVWRNRWNPYEQKPIEESGELCYLLRRVVNSDKSRLDALDPILEKHRKLIIFYNHTYELEMLREHFDSIVLREWNGEKHEEIPKTDSWVYLVQYSAGAEGWNCIETDAIIFFSQSYSYRMTVQAAGRIDRMNTPYKELYYYKLRSTAPIDLAINRALVNKRNFNEKAFLGK